MTWRSLVGGSGSRLPDRRSVVSPLLGGAERTIFTCNQLVVDIQATGDVYTGQHTPYTGQHTSRDPTDLKSQLILGG